MKRFFSAAEMLATQMKSIFTESNSLRFTALGTNALRVFATPEIHERLRRQIDPTGKGSDVVARASLGARWERDVAKGGYRVTHVYQSDPDIRYVLLPNQRGWIDDGFVTTNSLGFRGREVTLPKPDEAPFLQSPEPDEWLPAAIRPWP